MKTWMKHNWFQAATSTVMMVGIVAYHLKTGLPFSWIAFAGWLMLVIFTGVMVVIAWRANTKVPPE